MKYIDADKLIAEIERRIEETKPMKPSFDQFWDGQISAFKGAIKIIHSLQQDKDVLDLCSRVWWEDRGWMMIPPNVTLKGIESLLMQLRKKLQAESSDFDDADPKHLVHTHQEQPEIDLEKEIDDYYRENLGLILSQVDTKVIVSEIARHFYELGLNARK